MNTIFTKLISESTGISQRQVAGTVALLEEGCTIPFISRYRKEVTGALDEVQVASVSGQLEKMNELAKRKETILKTIEEQGKLTPELKSRVEGSWDSTNWRIYTCRSNPRGRPVQRWLDKRDWSHWQLF